MLLSSKTVFSIALNIPSDDPLSTSNNRKNLSLTLSSSQNFTNITKHFFVLMSVDSSMMIEKTVFLNFSTKHCNVYGANTFTANCVAFFLLLCKLLAIFESGNIEVHKRGNVSIRQNDKLWLQI